MECTQRPGDQGGVTHDRMVISTHGRSSSSFCLPLSMVIERVVYRNSDIPEGLECFEAPISTAWLRMYTLDGPPETEREVRWMLRAGYEKFHRPVWYVFQRTLYLFPPAPCDGKLVVDYVA